MGSLDKAVITGFICRLCSRMNRFVLHVYGEEGERLRLAEKINIYLPISISMNDPLPKTVCVPCIQRLETHHALMKQFSLARTRLVQSSSTSSSSSEASGSSSTHRYAPFCTPPAAQPSTSQASSPTAQQE